MKFKMFVCTLAILSAVLMNTTIPAETTAAEPVNLIFDTDLGNDIDDVLALAMLNAFITRGDCNLLAITLTKDNSYAPRITDLINTFYGHDNIPIGRSTSSITPDVGGYLLKTAETKDEAGNSVFPWFDVNAPKDYEAALPLLRKTLAAAEDASVVFVQVGFSTNMAALLDSPADDISPLTGKELIAKKIKFCSVMAGAYTPELAKHREYNVAIDVPSAKKFFSECPVPIYASGFEVGLLVPTNAANMNNDYNYCPHHPVQIAYHYYRGYTESQPTWDLTSVLYAVRPDRDYFGVSPAGIVHVADDGTTSFEEKADGNTHFLTINDAQAQRVQEVFVWLCSEPPCGK